MLGISALGEPNIPHICTRGYNGGDDWEVRCSVRGLVGEEVIIGSSSTGDSHDTGSLGVTRH